MLFSVHRFSMVLMCLFTGDVIFDHLIKRVSLIAIFLCYKATIFPFVIKKYLEGDTLRLCEYSFSL